MTKAFQRYIGLFFALEELLGNNGSEEAICFLSDANPFAWSDEGSLDPSIYDLYLKLCPQSGAIHMKDVIAIMRESDAYYEPVCQILAQANEEDFQRLLNQFDALKEDELLAFAKSKLG